MAAGPEPPERRFVGRPEALDFLRRREDEARSGRGGLTLLLGEAGVGKSTLLRLFGPECADRGLTVLVGRAGGLDNAPPLQIVRDALASGPGAERSGPLEPREISPLAAMVPSTPAPPVMIGFAAPPEGWAPRGGGGEDRLLEAIGRPGDAEERRTGRPFQAVTAQLRRLAERGPSVIFLEDLHRADDASFDFLEYLAPEIGRLPIWFVATSLPFAQVAELRRTRLERLQREWRAEELTLRPLSAQELPEFVRSLSLAREPDPEQLARWHAQTGGNPLFLERLVRSGVGAPAGEPPVAPAPERDSGALAPSLAQLPPEEARVLTAGAVLGHSFPFALLWAATGEEEERLSEEVERLVARGILREGFDEGIEFVHEELRARIYAGLTVSRRRLLHRKAGEALEARGSADAATIYALALHCHLGRLDDRSAVYNRIAAELATQAGSPTVARLHLERALEAHRRNPTPDPLGELEIRLDLAVQLDRLGELREADRLLTEAFEKPELLKAASPTQRALARLYRARLLTDQGRWSEADSVTAELLRSADVRSAPRTWLGAHRLRGELLYYRGEYAEALSHHDEALRIARQLHDEREIALETVRKSNVLGMMRNRLPEALAGYRLAAETLIRLGDLGEAAYAQLFLGVVESQNGRLEEGIRELQKALVLAQEGHDPRRIGWAEFNLADLFGEHRELPIARRHLARALETLTKVGDRFGLLQVRIVEGKLALADGDPGTAEIALLEAYRLVRELRTPADEIEVLLRLAEVARARGDRERARGRLAEAERIGLDRRPDLAEEAAALSASVREADGATADRG